MGDPGTHASATEDADVCRETGGKGRVSHVQLLLSVDDGLHTVGLRLGLEKDGLSEVVDGGDDRHGERGDAVEDPGADAGQCVRPAPIAQLGDVRAGSEDSLGTVASLDLATGDDEDAGIVFQLVTDGVQVIDHGLIDGVADLGAVEADERVGVGGLDTQGGEGHP